MDKLISKIRRLLGLIYTESTPSQKYWDDNRYIYNLIIVNKECTFSRVFSTSVPLADGNNIVLESNQSFRVLRIAHVVYTPNDDPVLTRNTTLLHVGIAPNPGTYIEQADLQKMGFKIKPSIRPYTIH